MVLRLQVKHFYRQRKLSHKAYKFILSKQLNHQS